MARNVAVSVGTIPPLWDGVSIQTENARTGDLPVDWKITGAGDLTNQGFARSISVSVGATQQFSCHGTGTVLDVYRIGYYAGRGARKVATLTNTATSQPNPTTIPNSNGGTTATAWSVTATWAVPADAVSGMYIGVLRNTAQTDASWIPFIVRDDARPADIIIKSSDSTWGVAYSPYGSPGSVVSGKSYYDSSGFNSDIDNRAHVGTYHKPIITRQSRATTYWYNGEAPLFRWVERNGYSVKYISSQDLDQNPNCLDNGGILVSIGHDEYWSQNMHDRAVAYRGAGKHTLFMSANEHFWRTRFTDAVTQWCFKDTMPGPGSHTAGVALDPVSWTGTWKDTRAGNDATRDAENNTTGTDFRMNGDTDNQATFSGLAGYASHPAWRNTAVASGTDVTVQGVVGFEADRMLPTRTGAVTLASRTFSINGSYADDNGQNYTGNGDLSWGVVSQRWPSGAVVVGFGTTQWAWGLDNDHDRGSSVANVTMQQFQYNLFRDLGAAPTTLMAGLTASAPQALTNYGSTAP